MATSEQPPRLAELRATRGDCVERMASKQLHIPAVGRRLRLWGGRGVSGVGRQLRLVVGGGDLNVGVGCIGLLREDGKQGGGEQVSGLSFLEDKRV